MDGFTIVDGAVAVIILISALLAYSRGIVREIMAIVGWIVAGVLAYVLAPSVQPLVSEIPVLSDYISDSCELGLIVSFVAVFALALVMVSVFTPLLSGAIRDSALGPADQTLGFLFGAARGVLLVAVAFLVYQQVAATGTVASVEASRTAAIFERNVDRIDGTLPNDAPGWIVQRYEGLVATCAI